MSVQTERLEHEAETTRRQLSATIDELRGRLTPGQVLDEVTGFARDGMGGDFVRNLGRDIARNPMPVALAGAGLAWLMLARNGRAHADGYDTSYEAGGYEAGRAREPFDSVRGEAGDIAAGVTDRVTGAEDYVADRVDSMGESVSGMTAAARERTQDAYRSARARAHDLRDRVGSGGRRAAAGARNLGHSVTELCREQPLVLAGVGLALGALIGALLPRTETEDQLMGQQADNLKDQGAALASESYESATRTAHEAQTEASRGHEAESERLATGDERGLT